MDEDEEDWIEALNVARSRGKQPPKKKKTAAGELIEMVKFEGEMLTQEQNRRSSPRGGRWLGRCLNKMTNSCARRIVYWMYYKSFGMALEFIATASYVVVWNESKSTMCFVANAYLCTGTDDSFT